MTLSAVAELLVHC